MAVGLAMMNAEKDAKTKDSAAKRVEEAARTAQRKEEKEADEANKRNELLAGFEDEIKQKGTDGILLLSNVRMRLYIHYYFQQKVVNLTKTKKAELKAILLHLLKDHHAETETTMAMVAEISVGEAAVASPEASTGASLLAEEV